MTNEGKTVKVHYTGTLKDGTVFDSSREREPMEFTIGSGQLIPGFENATIDMQVGDVKTVTIPAEEAYGPHRDEMVMVVPRTQLPEGLNPVVGQQLQVKRNDGQAAIVIVSDTSEESITLDANHPMAGKDLIFEIELVEIK